MSYKTKLTDPKWQKKRLELFNLRGFKCEICGNEEKELHIHHRFYLKNRKPWEYDNDVFQVLCVDCHEKHHEESNVKIKEVIPKKYEELISSIEKLELFDIYNLIFILKDDDVDVNEMFSLLSNALNYSYLERALDILRDKQAIENLEIGLVTLQNRLEQINPELS
jgi:hypothetical protein